MLQLLGIGGLLACVAIILLLPRREWPRPPKWMRITAVAIALALAILSVVVFQATDRGRDSPGGLVVLALAGAVAFLALRLVLWAWIGRVHPRSIWAALGPDAPPRSRGQSR